MIYLPTIDPVALRLGALEFRWYGVMYVLAFTSAWFLGRYRAAQSQKNPGAYGVNAQNVWTKNAFDDLLTLGMLGVILGGRLGYVLFYDLPHYISYPLRIIEIWQGGMSFHGGLLGVLCMCVLFARRTKRTFLQVTDFIAPLVPLGLFFGRIGNFINGELWGNVTNLPWGVVFPHAGALPRHPSQLYEALLEGLALFILLWIYSAKPRAVGAVSGVFALGYGLARFCVEFLRTPDAHLGYIAFHWLTMGQLLSLPLIGIGIFLLSKTKKL